MPVRNVTSLDGILGTEFVCQTDSEFGWRGEGFVRVDDGWVSIPGALPGETVRVRVDEEIGRGRRTFARLLEVLEPSPSRTNPHCPKVDFCRGCQLRHTTPENESQFKEWRIRELLVRHAELDWPDVGRIGCDNRRTWGYRWRANLTYRADGTPKLGLVSSSSPNLVGMSDCTSLTIECQQLIESIEKVFDEFDPVWPDSGAGGVRNVEVWASSPAWIRVVPRSVSTRTAEQLQPLLRRLEAALPSAIVCGEPHDNQWVDLPYRASGYELAARPGAWVHATLEPAEALYDWLQAWLQANEGPHLDVGCGIGAIALLSESVGRPATGIDRDRNATDSAEHNAQQHGFSPRFLTADWQKGARELALDGATFTTATLNPMREPIGAKTLAFIDRLVTTKLLLLGPSPEAATKEASQLLELGWELSRVWSVDLHPASYQTMMAAELVRNSPANPRNNYQ